MMQINRRSVGLLILGCLLGCGKSYNGTFKGNALTYTTPTSGSITSATSTITLVLEEKSDSVIGSWSSTTGSSGSVNATITKGTLDPVSIIDTTGCKATYTGVAYFDPDIPGDDTLKGNVKSTTTGCGGTLQTFLTLQRVKQ